MSDLTMALAGLTSSVNGYASADAYFCGVQGEVVTSRRMAWALRHAGMRFRLNYARIPVTAVLDRLEISGVSTPDTRANAALQVIWEENAMQLWSNDVHRDALKLGDTYLQVWPDEGGFPEMHLTSPISTKIIYHPQYPRRKMLAINTWLEPDDRGRVDLYYSDRIERYVTKSADKEFSLEEGAWEPYLDDQAPDDGVLENPYGEIPFFHFRTERPYGRPEHSDAYGPQDAINKHVTQQITANDFQSFPQRYLLSEMGGTAVPGTGVVDEDDDWDEGAVTSTGNVRSTAQTGPGTLLEFIGQNLQIGEFSAASPSVFLEPLRFYIQSISDTTTTPIHMFRGMGDVPSGEALRAAEAPLNKKVHDRQTSFGAAWSEALEFALKTIGLDALVSLAWRDPQSVESKDVWDVVTAKLAAGVPPEVALHEAGYPLEEVRQWFAAAASVLTGDTVPEQNPTPTIEEAS
jgi:hypothetical protein